MTLQNRDGWITFKEHQKMLEQVVWGVVNGK